MWSVCRWFYCLFWLRYQDPRPITICLEGTKRKILRVTACQNALFLSKIGLNAIYMSIIVLQHFFDDLFFYRTIAALQLTSSLEWMQLMAHTKINLWTRATTLNYFPNIFSKNICTKLLNFLEQTLSTHRMPWWHIWFELYRYLWTVPGLCAM